MKPTPEMLYLQIGWLVRDMPEFSEQHGAGITPEMNSWLAKAVVLVELTGNLADEIMLSAISNRMGSVNQMGSDKQAIAAIVNRALAKAEMLAPASISGKFIWSAQGVRDMPGVDVLWRHWSIRDLEAGCSIRLYAGRRRDDGRADGARA